MGKFIAYILAGLMALPTPVLGAETVLRGTDSEGFYTLKNLLKDSGGETTGGAASPYWTASGGTSFNRTSTSTKVARGNYALLFDASAASQTVTATAVAIPEGMKGKNGVVSCVFKATTGTATHTLTADDGSGNNFVTPVTIASSTTSFQRTSVNFIFPTSGNVRLKITSAADEPETAIDDCYLGLAEGFNVMQVSQAQYVGSVSAPGTTSCSWSTTSTTFTNFSAVAACPVPTADGSVSAPATKILGVLIPNYAPGEYLIIANAAFTRSNVDQYPFFRFSDGTNVTTEQASYVSGASYIQGGNLIGRIRNTTPQANVTIQVQARVSVSTASAFIDATTYPTNISIYRFPLSTDQAFRADQVIAPTVQKFTSGSGTYTKPNNATYIRVRMVGGGAGGNGSGNATTYGVGGAGGNTTFGSSLLVANGAGVNSLQNAGTPGTASLGTGPVGTALSGAYGPGLRLLGRHERGHPRWHGRIHAIRRRLAVAVTQTPLAATLGLRTRAPVVAVPDSSSCPLLLASLASAGLLADMWTPSSRTPLQPIRTPLDLADRVEQPERTVPLAEPVERATSRSPNTTATTPRSWSAEAPTTTVTTTRLARGVGLAAPGLALRPPTQLAR
jgi:hypothetical protein